MSYLPLVKFCFRGCSSLTKGFLKIDTFLYLILSFLDRFRAAEENMHILGGNIMKTRLYNFLHNKTGVYRGIHYFSAQKHSLWVLVRTASLRRF